MEDIRLAIGLIGFVSVAVFAMTYRLLRSRSNMSLDLSAVLIVLLIGVYVRTVWGQLWIVQWIPLPSVIVLSNWFPPLLAALGAIVWLRLGTQTKDGSQPSGGRSSITVYSVLRRLPVMLMLLVAAVYSLMYFIPTEPPQCGNQWDLPDAPMIWPVCRQTTPHTCSAASAATILYTLGIEATEQEMARLCLTKSGTTWLGLYHGLSTKLLGTAHKVEFFEGDVATLREMANIGPVLMCCQLDPEVAFRFPEYEKQGGWIPGMAHSVVYFGMLANYHVVGDPSRGYEFWTTEDLETLWTHAGLKITQRRPQGAP